MSKREHPLEHVRHPDVFGPNEAVPEPGSREPFFAKGGFVTLLTIVAVFSFSIWFKLEGYSAALKAWVGHLLFGL